MKLIIIALTLLVTACSSTVAVDESTASTSSAAKCQGPCPGGPAEDEDASGGTLFGGYGDMQSVEDMIGQSGDGIDRVIVTAPGRVFRDNIRRWKAIPDAVRAIETKQINEPGSGKKEAPKAIHLSCSKPEEGEACRNKCFAIDAFCNGYTVAHGETGALFACKSGSPTYSCSWRFPSGMGCSQVNVIGGIRGPLLCIMP